MEATADRKQTAFRLKADLLNRLRIKAKKENRSLNNYVESVLMDVVYRTPNQETIAAIEEARTGKFAGRIDMTDFDSFMKSVNEIE